MTATQKQPRGAWGDLPKGRFDGGDSAVEKAIAMLRQGKSQQFVSDYLGMDPKQVAATARDMVFGSRIGRPRADLAGPPLAVTPEDLAFRLDALNGSDALLRAIRGMQA